MALPEPPPHPAAEAGDLQQRRREIGRGLRRSHLAVLVASFLVGLLAVAAVWLSLESQHRAEEAQAARQRAETNAAAAHGASTRLWEFSSRAARQQRLTRTVGQRSESLEIIREAARFRPARELRDEALSALLLPDVGTNLVWQEESRFEIAAAYDAAFEHFILNNDHRNAIVRRATDGATLMAAKGLGRGTPFWQFSPDGRLAAMAFLGGQIGVWDWRQTNLVAQIPTIDAVWAEPPFDFSPDGQQLWHVTTNQALACFDLQSRELSSAITPGHPARSVRLSPSGKFAAIAGGKDLEVWELVSRTLRAGLTLTNEIWRLAWQPGEERLAIGCDGGLFLWDIGAPEATALARGDATTVVFFNADGDLLFTAGGAFAAEAWSIRDRRAVLQFPTLAPLGLSRDQTRLAVSQGRVGYGIRQYLPPVGRRDWAAPPAVGAARWSADVDAQERWLLTAHTGGWLIRDTDSGRELARGPSEKTLAVSFSVDGSNVLSWTQAGLQRWPISAGNDHRPLTVGTPQTIWKNSGPPLDNALFAAGRRYTTCCQTGMVTVVDVEEPTKALRFPLERPRDISHYLSPDGHWLITGYHNTKGWIGTTRERESSSAGSPRRGLRVRFLTRARDGCSPAWRRVIASGARKPVNCCGPLLGAPRSLTQASLASRPMAGWRW